MIEVDPRLQDHAVGLELQIVELAHQADVAAEEARPAEEAHIRDELSELYDELAVVAERLAEEALPQPAPTLVHAEAVRDGPVRVVVRSDTGAAGSVTRALAAAAERVELVSDSVPGEAPDLVLVELAQPDPSEGLAMVRGMLMEDPRHRVVIWTVHDDPDVMLEALRGGVAGFLHSSMTDGELVDHLERAHAGEVVVDPQLATRAVLELAHRTVSPPLGRVPDSSHLER
jgi:DNA-binding NarL/FixJ family response regulator